MTTQMESWWRGKIRSVALLLALPMLVTCRGTVYELPLCSSTVTQEPTSVLATDLIGAWNGTTDEASWHHPIAYMAALPDEGDRGGRIWMFRDDGSGHVWWVLNAGETGSYENDEEFVWEVVDERLVVNDFPPATVEVYSDDNFLMHPIDETVDPEEGLVARRCDLDVPEGVRGQDE